MGNRSLARVLFQTALDLAEERQGGLLVVVADPSQAIGRLIAPHDVLEVPDPPGPPTTRSIAESPARPFSLFGIFDPLDPGGDPGPRIPASVRRPWRADAEPLAKRSIHYLARGGNVTDSTPPSSKPSPASTAPW